MNHLFISLPAAAAFGFWIGGYINHISVRFAEKPSSPPPYSLMIRFMLAVCLCLCVCSIHSFAEWFIAIPFAIVLVGICFIDLFHKVIPDIVTLPGILVAMILRLCIHPLPLLNYVLAALVGAGVFYLIALFIQLTSKRDSIGGGDIKMLAMTGIVLGLKLSILSVLLFSFAGFIAGLFLLVTKKHSQEFVVPFGPFIAVASLVSYLWGSSFLNWSVHSML
ncbi:prepilin peptidase [Paenibacillus sp. MWE-103]|uniref:Prepilin peptidase n=1 Tax=Paenibacillus artemisiicola TaxID=1172618 RepID=A0ABS3WBZ1_9BACL|nr:A24 family peptidase [Paenibacillus artemisiicola]MBO7745823.1 prepilin peptidase [Paenibacillus artemisiicola]